MRSAFITSGQRRTDGSHTYTILGGELINMERRWQIHYDGEFDDQGEPILWHLGEAEIASHGLLADP